MKLTNDHIDYIIKDLNYRGIVASEIQDELIDHLCSAVEEKMREGQKFIDAYHGALKSFGHYRGLQTVQEQTLKIEHNRAKNMIRNYLTIAWRNLRKQRGYSFINIAGLAIGIAACLTIVLFIIDELGYDAYNLQAKRIYRLNHEIKFNGNHSRMTYSPAPFAHAMQQDYPEIEATVRFRNYGSYLIKTADGNENIKEKNIVWTDSTFFKIFSAKILAGDPATALKEPGSIAITKTMADKYFPNKDALGQQLIVDNKYNVRVTAVYEDLPKASHFHFNMLIPMVGDYPVAKEAQSVSFLNNNFQTYILLKDGTSASALQQKFTGFLEKYVTPQIKQALGSDFSMSKFRSDGNLYEVTLMPLLDIHLHSDLNGEFEPNGSITYVYLFSTIAAFILAIACINFMNMSTARSANRAKEVGVRKVMGSLRPHLIRQFLTESILITSFAMILAVGIVALSLPFFNTLSSKDLHLPLRSPFFYLLLLAATFLIGLLAGSYPSFFLSAFRPINVLKGNVSLGMKSGYIRSALVVFQFVISLLLIIGAIAVNSQLAYIQNKKIGFNKDQVIILHDGYALRPNVQAFKNEVLKLNIAESVTVSGFYPIEGMDSWRSSRSFWKDGNQPTPENLINLQSWWTDADYVKTLGMKIKLGRDFSTAFPSDSSGVILNETAVREFDLGEEPIGKKIATFRDLPDGRPDPSNFETSTVIGVVEDFHFSSMKVGILPLGIFLGDTDGSIAVRFSAGKTNLVIKSLAETWRRLAPGQPFQYSFLDDDFSKMYTSEQRLGQLFFVFASLAIAIACLGLFALTAFTAEQRTKEIGIRKVLGASVANVVLLLSKEFGKLIIVACVIAMPLAWYGVNWWLTGYTYKTKIGVMVYAVAGLVTFVIAWATMGFQSVKAASKDPVKSLRSE